MLSPQHFAMKSCDLNVVFPTCYAVDVRKSFLVATIIKTPKNSLQPSYQKKLFLPFNSDLYCFADCLNENDCWDICMDTGCPYSIFWKNEVSVLSSPARNG